MKTSSISGNAVYKTLIFHGMLINFEIPKEIEIIAGKPSYRNTDQLLNDNFEKHVKQQSC